MSNIGARLFWAGVAGIALEGGRIALEQLLEARGEARWDPTEGLDERAGRSPLFHPHAEMDWMGLIGDTIRRL